MDLFFVISGLVIFLSARRYYREWPKGGKWIAVFLRRRFFRIVPLYFVTLFIFLIVITPEMLLLPLEQLAKHLGAHLLFVHNWFPDTHGSINGANWTIGLEMQFYLMMALLLPAFKSVRRGFWLCLSMIVISWIWRAGTFWLLRDSNAFDIFQVSTQLPGTLDAFGLGIFLGLLIDERRISLRPSLGFVSTLILTTAGIAYIAWRTIWGVPDYWHNPYMVTFFRSLLAFAFVLICLISVSTSSLLKPIDILLNYLGKVSYGIYLWHLLVILSLKKVGITEPREFLMLCLVLTISLSSLTYHLLEKPWLNHARKEVKYDRSIWNRSFGHTG